MKIYIYQKSDYLTAGEPEQHVAHMPPMLPPGPACNKYKFNLKSVHSSRILSLF